MSYKGKKSGKTTNAAIAAFQRPSALPRRNIAPDLIMGIALIVATVTAYWPVHECGFVNFDDPEYLSANSHVRSGITGQSAAWAFTTFQTCNWHPLTWLSLMLDVQCFGINPAVHHAINLVFHILNTLLLFIVFRIMTRALWPSAFIAALFALHPLHVESVAWISERKDVLSTFFWMLSLLSYVYYTRKPGWKRNSLVILSFALGLLAKPMLVTLPAVLLLLDFWPLGRISFSLATVRQAAGLGKCLVEKIPLLVLALLSCIVTMIAQRTGGAVVPFAVLPFSIRVANALISYVKYLLMMLWPAHLAVYYPPARGALPVWQPALAALALATVSWLVFKYRRRFPYLVTGWLWYVGTLVPVIGLVQVGDQALADRYTYVPLIGVFVMIAWLARDASLHWRIPRYAVVASCSAVLLALSFQTRNQAGTWHDSVSLFTRALDATSDNNLRAHRNLGVALADEFHRFDEAADHCRKAISLDPSDADLYYNLGNALMGSGRTDEAIDAYRTAVRMNPGEVNAYFNCADALASRQKYQEAVSSWLEALRLQPGDIGALFNIGSAYCMMGKFQDAIPFFQKALTTNPNNLDAWCNMGFAYEKSGDGAHAADAYEQALRIDPSCTRAAEALKNVKAPN